MKKSLLLLVVVSLFIASPVIAKEGFYIGAFIPTNTISGDAGSGIDSGTGWGLRVGVGFNRYFAIEGNYTTTKHDLTGGSSTDLKGLAGDLRMNFPLTSLDSAQIMSVEPYILLGYGHYELTKPSTVKSDGGQYGVGIELYLFRELSIHAGWTKTKVTFKDSTTNAETGGDVKTVDFGLIYHFI